MATTKFEALLAWVVVDAVGADHARDGAGKDGRRMGGSGRESDSERVTEMASGHQANDWASVDVGDGMDVVDRGGGQSEKARRRQERDHHTVCQSELSDGHGASRLSNAIE